MAEETDPIEDAEVPEGDQLEQERPVAGDDAPVPRDAVDEPPREPNRPR